MSATPQEPIRILFVEDMPDEADLSVAQLKRAGLVCVAHRVETEPDLRTAFEQFQPTVILSDFSLPRFDGMSALTIAREMCPQTPFIFVSGTIGEERAINALLCGAADYVLKSNPARLAPAVRRALDDVEVRKQREQQQALIARLDRVLRMLSGVNALVVRIRDRTELLRETCRLAISAGGYATAIVAAKTPGAFALQPVAWSGVNDKMTDALRAVVAESATRPGSIIGRVMQSGSPFVCNDSGDLDGTTNF